MGITVIPAYRVVSKYAIDARGLPLEKALDSLVSNTRGYVRNLLSMVHPSIMELGERSTITQLGDPDLDNLIDALRRLESGSPKRIVERTLVRCTERLARPDLNARVFLLPGDGESRVLVRQMNGVLGFSLGSQATLVFLWPTDSWERWLAYTVSHEYFHLVRNLLFPRGLADGKLVYMKSREPETLLDALIVEGLADAFATRIHTQIHPAWTGALSSEEERRLWPRVHRRFTVSDPTEIRRVLFGDNDRIPPWTGYTLGFRIVQSYLEAQPHMRPENLIGVHASEIFGNSGYAPAP